VNEIIYILINESMPGYVKIGKTGNILTFCPPEAGRQNVGMTKDMAMQRNGDFFFP